jgi:predicted transporter
MGIVVAVIVVKVLIEVGIAGAAFVYITSVSGEVCIVICIPDPDIISTISNLISLGAAGLGGGKTGQKKA